VTVAGQLMAITFVFGLLWGAIALIRRKEFVQSYRPNRPGRSPDSMRRLERIVLTPQHTLHLISIGGSRFVIATHSHGCSFYPCIPSSEGVREEVAEAAALQQRHA
jgi:flagellar biogenesis protein FliO